MAADYPPSFSGKEALCFYKTAGIQQQSGFIGCRSLLPSVTVTNQGGNPPYGKLRRSFMEFAKGINALPYLNT
jgi:hypothetical protein